MSCAQQAQAELDRLYGLSVSAKMRKKALLQGTEPASHLAGTWSAPPFMGRGNKRVNGNLQYIPNNVFVNRQRQKAILSRRSDQVWRLAYRSPQK